MSYRGPKVKKSRRLGIALSLKAQKGLERRPGPPGMHQRTRRQKMSDYGRQLQEKQRLRFQYNVSEKQLRRYYKEASRLKLATPEALIQLLESRLDNLVFRAGLARSIHAARQYVRHGHFEIDGKRVDIPSYHVEPGTTVTVREKSKKMECFSFALSTTERVPYINTEDTKLSFTYNSVPAREEITAIVCDVPVVVEYYSR